jgi:hypothetical protein
MISTCTDVMKRLAESILDDLLKDCTVQFLQVCDEVVDTLANNETIMR